MAFPILVAVSVAVALSAGAAQAQQPTPWAGFYVGAHAGWSDWTLARPDDKTSPTQAFDGYFGGAQIGYDAQIPNTGIVLGVVADYSIGELSGPTYKDGTYITVNSEIDAFGTLRGRLGFAMGHFMPYVTGGAAWMKGSTSESCPAGALGGHCKAVGAYAETDNFSRWGWAYGGGAEIKLADHISIFAEYLRLDFGTETHDLGPKSWDREVKIDGIDTVRSGVNFKF